jgi:uncharacterized protein YjbI with pentapeptide repeats
MQSEIERVLEMVKDGTLTSEQAAEIIVALKDALGTGAGRVGDETVQSQSRETREAGDEPRRRHRHRRHGRHRGLHGIDTDFGDDIERALGAGARTLRWALKSGLQLGGSSWGGESNSAVLSRADTPTGVDFVCEANELAVSHLRDVRLSRSTFSHNDLNAANMQDIELNDSRMTKQHLRGSSIKGALIEHGELADNQFNGAGIVNLTVSHGRLVGSHFNGAQVRDLGISSSAIESSRFNGTKLKTVVLKADSLVKGLSVNGVLGRNWLLEGGVVAEVELRGVRIDGLVLERSGLEKVTFETTDWSEQLDPGSLGLIRDLELDRVILKECSFEDCRFDRTRFEGFEASKLSFRGVDFSGMAITSAEQLAKLSGARDVA